MVRLVPDSSGAEAPLYLSLFAEGSEEPLVLLQVNEPRMWLLDTVTVLRKPPGCNAGKHFTNVSQALGVLQEWLPSNRRGRMAYLRHMHAYIVGEFDDTKVEAIPFVGEGGSTLRLEHSPAQATVRVRCHSRACGADGHEGRWVPVGALRPFAPPNLSDEQMKRAVVSMMIEGKHVPKNRRHRGAEEGELHATKRRADAPLDCGQSSKPRVGEGGEPPGADGGSRYRVTGGVPQVYIFAGEHEVGGFSNPKPPGVPWDVGDAQRRLFGPADAGREPCARPAPGLRREAPAQPPPQPGGASGGHLSDGELPDEEAPRHDEGRPFAPPRAPAAEAARPRGGASSSGPPLCHAPCADAAPARQLPGGPARHHGLRRAAPPKERQRHDKPGNVVFCRDELPHRPLVSEGSRNGAQSKSHLGTQKTVFARPLLGESAPVESHPLSRLESLKERLPAMYDEWCRTKSESVGRLIARCVKKQHERAHGMQTPQQTCEHLMPRQWRLLHVLAFA